MGCDTWAREKDSHLPLTFKRRMLWEFECNKPEWRIPLIVYLLEYQNHIAFVDSCWIFCFVLVFFWSFLLFFVFVCFGVFVLCGAFCLCAYVWFLFCLKNYSWELVRIYD